MKKLLLVILAFGSVLLVLGCAHQMTWEEWEQREKQARLVAFWKKPVCDRLLEGGCMNNLSSCINPEERHSPEQLAEIVKEKATAEAKPFCREMAIRDIDQLLRDGFTYDELKDIPKLLLDKSRWTPKKVEHLKSLLYHAQGDDCEKKYIDDAIKRDDKSFVLLPPSHTDGPDYTNWWKEFYAYGCKFPSVPSVEEQKAEWDRQMDRMEREIDYNTLLQILLNMYIYH
ncbi:MAG: hypothetical protein ACLQGU_00310 [bacterium]